MFESNEVFLYRYYKNVQELIRLEKELNPGLHKDFLKLRISELEEEENNEADSEQMKAEAVSSPLSVPVAVPVDQGGSVSPSFPTLLFP